MRTKMFIGLTLACAFGMLLTAFMLLRLLQAQQSASADPIPRAEYNPPHVVSDFTLTNHDGQHTSLSDVRGGCDTPDMVKRFVQSFDPDFIGLTGDEAEVQQIAEEFRGLFDAPTPAPHTSHDGQEESYMVSHTPYSYLLDKQGRWRFLYVSRTPIEVIVQDIRRALAE